MYIYMHFFFFSLHLSVMKPSFGLSGTLLTHRLSKLYSSTGNMESSTVLNKGPAVTVIVLPKSYHCYKRTRMTAGISNFLVQNTIYTVPWHYNI